MLRKFYQERGRLDKWVLASYNKQHRCGCSSAVERLLAMQKVAGSNPVTRSSRGGGIGRRYGLKIRWGPTLRAGSSPALGTP